MEYVRTEHSCLLFSKYLPINKFKEVIKHTHTHTHTQDITHINLTWESWAGDETSWPDSRERVYKLLWCTSVGLGCRKARQHNSLLTLLLDRPAPMWTKLVLHFTSVNWAIISILFCHCQLNNNFACISKIN